MVVEYFADVNVKPISIGSKVSSGLVKKLQSNLMTMSKFARHAVRAHAAAALPEWAHRHIAMRIGGRRWSGWTIDPRQRCKQIISKCRSLKNRINVGHQWHEARVKRGS